MNKLKRLIVITIMTSLIAMGMSNPIQVEAGKKTQAEIESERAVIKEELSAADAEIVDILLDLKELSESIAQNEAALAENQEMLEVTKSEIAKTEEEIAALQLEITTLEENIEMRFEILKKRFSSYQENGGSISYLEVLFESESFSDFISRASVVSKIMNSDTELMAEQEVDKALVEIHQAEVEDKLNEQKEFKNELEEMEALILDQQEKNKAMEEELKEKESELLALKADLESQDSELAQLEAEIRQEIAGIDYLVGHADYDGQFLWPTSGGYISSYQGNRWGRLHKGIDIARRDRSSSPPIFAAESGTVVSAGYSGGYGNRVVIDHGDGLQTTYSHLSSLSVEANQSVERGDQIGVMGKTGNSTGVHLHFEVYKNGTLHNPMDYIK